MRTLRAMILATLPVVALVSACGQKGPLVLPPPPPAQQSKAPASTPVDRPADRVFPDVPATTEKK